MGRLPVNINPNDIVRPCLLSSKPRGLFDHGVQRQSRTPGPCPWRLRFMTRLGAGLMCAALAGCSHLLPRQRAEDITTFDSFEAARKAIEQVVPYKTTAADLKALGFDVHASSNVVQVPYPEVVGRLVPLPNTPLETLDPGIRDCIAAREQCRAYEFHLSHISTKREGGFWADFLNFHRTTFITGWRFNGLIAMRDGVVLFSNYGGEPRVDRVEDANNPLGPLQSSGEGAAVYLLH